MTLRTPRRRISPRTKRRYRAVREFFKKALGSGSQSNIKISSSIANVTDLKHKIVGLEHQINEVSKHCRDLSCLETSFRREVDNYQDSQPSCLNHGIETIPEQTEHTHSHSDHRKTNSSTTKILYKNSDTVTRKSEESDYAEQCDCGHCEPIETETRTIINSKNQGGHIRRNKGKYNDQTGSSCDPVLQRHRTQSAVENFNSAYSTSYQSLHKRRASPDEYTGRDSSRNRFIQHREYIEAAALEGGRRKRHKERKASKSPSPTRYNMEERHDRRKKNKSEKQVLDSDYITEIIRRQYRPVKMFGRQNSAISQFSAPVCRDQEFPIKENIQQDPDLCSCGRQPNQRSKYVCDHDVSDMRSICDTRLYSSKKYSRPKHRKRHTEAYNDAELYDLIPVKEKSSPKSRRKFAEDNLVGYVYREVPPSPRTNRPRLNLKAQYFSDYDDCNVHLKPEIQYVQQKPKRKQEYYVEDIGSDITSEYVVLKRKGKQKAKPVKIQANLETHREAATTSSLHYATLTSEPSNSHELENSLNKTHDSVLSDKTDKALCEIKDILQNFLQEIKKDTSPQNSQENTAKNTNTQSEQRKTNGPVEEKGTTVSCVLPNAQNSFNYGVLPQACHTNTGFMPQFPNPCCYPVMPVYPIANMHSGHNCTANGYTATSISCACHACNVTSRENLCQDCSKNKTDTALDTSTNIPVKRSETEELIKEIYKYVSQNSNTPRKKTYNEKRDKIRRREEVEDRLLTSRSVGESVRMSRHDAKVGTPAMKCYSKSCEAIGSRLASDTYYTSATHSDTILEKLSLQVTQSDSDISTTDYTVEKTKKSKFKNTLRKLLFKKKKKDVIEELSESESSLEVDVKAKNARERSQTRSRSPSPPHQTYRQEVTNYMMHGEEYYHRPHMYHPRHDEPYPMACRYDPRTPCCAPPVPCCAPPVQELYSPHHVHQQTIHEHAVAGQYPPEAHPHVSHAHHTPHYYDPHSGQFTPQVPLCLKEIEVKSTGTQSERKMSLLKKIGMRPQPQPRMRSDQPMLRSEQHMMRSEPQKMFPSFSQYVSPSSKDKGLISGWKKLHAKAEAQARAQQLAKENKQKMQKLFEDPMNFQQKTQKELAVGDEKMKHVMLKKLFYKRNPFSPNNLIIKTLMGRDPASFGEPNITLRPKLFF